MSYSCVGNVAQLSSARDGLSAQPKETVSGLKLRSKQIRWPARTVVHHLWETKIKSDSNHKRLKDYHISPSSSLRCNSSFV